MGEASGLSFTILVIDDEEESAELLRSLLERRSEYRVLWAPSGVRGLRMAAGELPDLVILDLMMPGMPGEEVCRRLREQEKTFYLPILILTADRRLEREVECLELGADDYLIRPVGPERLMARIQGLIRRRRFRGNSQWIIRVGGAALDVCAHCLSVGEQAIRLTPLESGICALLMSAEGRFVDKKVLYKKLYHAWPPALSATVKAHVRNIRGKLGPLRELIMSDKGQGYGFNVEFAHSHNPPR